MRVSLPAYGWTYRGGWGNRPKEFLDWVYTVRLDQDPSKASCLFAEADLTLVRPYIVRELDKLIERARADISKLEDIQNRELKHRGLA